jgi:pimeloyl-ACP methyl ester carboxylesterase
MRVTMLSTGHWVLCSAWLSLAVACSNDRKAVDDADGGETKDARCPVVVAEADCDRSQRPFVFVHGLYGSGDNIANVALLLASNGYCSDRFYAIDYESLNQMDQPGSNGDLDAFIDYVLAETKADKVELVGHSNGTINSRNYLLEGGMGNVVAAHAAKVAHYIHLAGGPLPVPSDPPTLCVASNSDMTATGLCPPQAAQTAVFEKQDHFAVAASDESFAAIYEFLRGEPPKYTTIQCDAETITLEAKAESFADNVVPVGSTTEIYELGDDPRKRGTPLETFTLGSDGVIGPWKAKRLTQYEFRGYDPQGKLVGHQYVSPFLRTNRWIRFLTPSMGAGAAATNPIVSSEGHSVVIARSYKGAFRKDLGDSLKVNGKEVLEEQFSNATSATVGLFLFDANQNEMSDGGSLSAYEGLPFIRGTDVYMDASTPGFIELDHDGTVMKVPNWPSTPNGPTVVIFP